MYRNVAVQIGQIDNSINNKNQGELSNKTEVNTREHVKAITLRWGRQLEDPPAGESKRTHESEEKENERENQETSVGEDSRENKV